MTINNKVSAIILAAGKGKRMKSDIQKQYLEINDKPVLYYTLSNFQKSCVDEIILVVGKGEEAFCKEDIVDKYGFNKVVKIISGGKERYDSVYNGLCQVQDSEFVLIHDGARPFANMAIIKNSIEAVKKYKACTVGMPVKDTIKVVNKDGFGDNTPDRTFLWQIQTPQSFETKLLKEAYEKLIEIKDTEITDDSMIIEKYMDVKVKVIEGDYKNIKITTPEDMILAKAFIDDNFEIN